MNRPAVLRLRPWEARFEPLGSPSSLAIHLVAGGASRAERFGSACFEPIDDPERVEARIERWRSFGAGLDVPFRQRLAVRGFTRPMLRRCLSPVRLRADAAPAWAVATTRIVDAIVPVECPKIATPAERLLAPFRGPVIDEVLRRWAPPEELVVAPKVMARLVAAVLDGWLERVLHAGDRPSAGDGATDAEIWIRWFTYHPALARSLGERLVSLSDAVHHLLHRLVRDTAKVAALLGIAPSAVRRVEDLHLGLGDAHGVGRSVCGLDLGSGGRVIFKPKKPGIARWFATLHAAVAERLPPEARTRPRRQPNRGEQRPHAAPLGSAADVDVFYRRAGVLTALAQAARIHDLHGENILPAGAWPVPIDLEVAGSPEPSLVDAQAPWMRSTVTAWMASADQVGLLPGIRPDAEGAGRYECAFPSRHERARRSGVCTPVLDGKAVCIEDHRESFCTGYAAARAALRAIDPSIRVVLDRSLADCHVRYVPRSTALYDALRLASLERHGVGETADLEVELERLPAETPADPPALVRLSDLEVWSLTHGVIPFFTVRPGRDSLAAAGGGRLQLGFHPVSNPLAYDASHRVEPTIETAWVRAAIGFLEAPW
ncbi:MAG: DUF4135 domain-containing protein [Planctomycetia bacterium]|nr:DUF4135 domain-containing protein [Planctomycetia bacterium]